MEFFLKLFLVKGGIIKWSPETTKTSSCFCDQSLEINEKTDPSPLAFVILLSLSQELTRGCGEATGNGTFQSSSLQGLKSALLKLCQSRLHYASPKPKSIFLSPSSWISGSTPLPMASPWMWEFLLPVSSQWKPSWNPRGFTIPSWSKTCRWAVPLALISYIFWEILPSFGGFLHLLETLIHDLASLPLFHSVFCGILPLFW